MSVVKAIEFSQSKEAKAIFNLRDIAAEAQAIIDSARREQEKILAQCRTEADQIRLQAQQEGHHQGKEQGFTEGLKAGKEKAYSEAKHDFAARSDETLRTLKRILENFDQAKQKLFWQAQQQTVALAVDIAQKVIKKAGLISPETSKENIKAALAVIARENDVVIKVNPQHLAYLEELAGRNELVLGEYESIRFEGNEEVEPGGCLVGTNHGEIDAQLDTQIARIADGLLMTAKNQKEN